MKIVTTTALTKIVHLEKRTKIIQGGTSSGKTFCIIIDLISKCINNPGLEVSIVAETIPHLRRGALKDFIKILKAFNIYYDDLYNRSLLKYTFSNGAYIEFFSADTPEKIRGARRDICFINEANRLSFDAFNELNIRTRKNTYLDFNPVSKFWAHDLQKDDNTDFIILTYKDNEALDVSIVEQIRKAEVKALTSSYWANWVKIYARGLIGSIQGAVYENYTVIDEIPKEAKLIGAGLDFGFSSDPSALIYIYKYNDKRIIEERLYKKKLVNQELAKYLPENTPIIADSAEPKSIHEIRLSNNRLIIKGAKKGKDSILHGIQLMQNESYLVPKNSINLIAELRGYVWDSDKTGKQINKPVGPDHLLDALRYHESEVLSRREYGKYYIR